MTVLGILLTCLYFANVMQAAELHKGKYHCWEKGCDWKVLQNSISFKMSHIEWDKSEV